MVVILNDVCEALHVLPWMGWGLENSFGHYVEFDPRLWHRKMARPLIRAKAGFSRLRQRPHAKMLHAISPHAASR